MWPKGPYAKRWRPGQSIVVRIGAPLAVEGAPGSRVDVHTAGREIMERITQLVSSLKPVVPDSRRALERSA